MLLHLQNNFPPAFRTVHLARLIGMDPCCRSVFYPSKVSNTCYLQTLRINLEWVIRSFTSRRPIFSKSSSLAGLKKTASLTGVYMAEKVR